MVQRLGLRLSRIRRRPRTRVTPSSISFGGILDRPSPRRRDHDLANLDRRIAGHDHSSLHCREPSDDETREHPPAEAMAVHKQFLSGAMQAAGQQLKCTTLLRAEAALPSG